jgi:uncharacterized protein YhbP (UPF0306 family)
MLNETIEYFIRNQKLATVCCGDEQNKPYCFSCFYAFDNTCCSILFKSSASSKHCQLMAQKPQVSGTMLPVKLNMFDIRGIQFSGTLLPNSHELMNNASAIYHKKFPFALTIRGDVFAIHLETIKMTVNRNGIGEKLNFQGN